MYVFVVVPIGTFTTVPTGARVFPLTSCTFSEATPKTELAAFTDTLIPVTVASAGIEIVPCVAARGFCVCPAVSVSVATAAPVVSTFAGLLHEAAPPSGALPALVGTCCVLLRAPDTTDAYAELLSTFVGFCQTLPVPDETATEGTLGPAKLPVVEVAVPTKPV